MGRPRQFDEDVVLDRALGAFWAHGFEATSITDLEAATGLAKGSLYKAFQGKNELFARALDKYLNDGRERMTAAFAGATSGRRGLEDSLRAVAKTATAGPVRKGCFAVNCTVERGPWDPEIRRRLVRHEREIQALYAAAIRRGIDEGDFEASLDPATAARFVYGVVQGIQVLAKSSLTPAQAEHLVQLTLRALS